MAAGPPGLPAAPPGLPVGLSPGLPAISAGLPIAPPGLSGASGPPGLSASSMPIGGTPRAAQADTESWRGAGKGESDRRCEGQTTGHTEGKGGGNGAGRSGRGGRGGKGGGFRSATPAHGAGPSEQRGKGTATGQQQARDWSTVRPSAV